VIKPNLIYFTNILPRLKWKSGTIPSTTWSPTPLSITYGTPPITFSFPINKDDQVFTFSILHFRSISNKTSFLPLFASHALFHSTTTKSFNYHSTFTCKYAIGTLVTQRMLSRLLSLFPEPSHSVSLQTPFQEMCFFLKEEVLLVSYGRLLSIIHLNSDY
jgi:hypothetical protein